MAKWDDVQYLKFGDERTRAAREPLARVPGAGAEHVVDLGCGPGNSTALLRERWPRARVVGVDNSPEMLARAQQDLPEVEWVLGDVAIFAPTEAVDVVFANAVLQWVPDHVTLVPALFDKLRSGGALAVQMPDNADEPSHRLMRDTRASVTPGRDDPRGGKRLLPVGEYYDLLAPRATRVDIWRTRYEHVMPDAAAIVEWVKGTGLRPYIDDLTDDERSAFLATYQRALDEAYPARRDGKRLFSFPRLFMVAIR
jgi:trans-aconitate 2-methyltransferase